MNNIPLAQDLALKRTGHAPVEQKPIYAWRDILAGDEIVLPPIVLLCPHGEERFDIAEVADTKTFFARHNMLIRNTAIANFFDLCAISLPLQAALPAR